MALPSYISDSDKALVEEAHEIFLEQLESLPSFKEFWDDDQIKNDCKTLSSTILLQGSFARKLILSDNYLNLLGIVANKFQEIITEQTLKVKNNRIEIELKTEDLMGRLCALHKTTLECGLPEGILQKLKKATLEGFADSCNANAGPAWFRREKMAILEKKLDEIENAAGGRNVQESDVTVVNTIMRDVDVYKNGPEETDDSDMFELIDVKPYDGFVEEEEGNGITTGACNPVPDPPQMDPKIIMKEIFGDIDISEDSNETDDENEAYEENGGVITTTQINDMATSSVDDQDDDGGVGANTSFGHYSTSHNHGEMEENEAVSTGIPNGKDKNAIFTAALLQPRQLLDSDPDYEPNSVEEDFKDDKFSLRKNKRKIVKKSEPKRNKPLVVPKRNENVIVVKVNGEERYTCRYCPLSSFKSYSNTYNHMHCDKNYNDWSHQCNKCKTKFRNKRNYNHHISRGALRCVKL